LTAAFQETGSDHKTPYVQTEDDIKAAQKESRRMYGNPEAVTGVVLFLGMLFLGAVVRALYLISKF
jgi:hypothetical protein